MTKELSNILTDAEEVTMPESINLGNSLKEFCAIAAG